jgi:PAS domain S-box-containing protein
MLSGVGFTIMFNPMELSYLFHYLLFGCLLFVVLIDYHYVLKGVEAPSFFKRREHIVVKASEPEPPVSRAPSFFTRKEKPSPQPIAPPPSQNVADLQRISDAMVQKIQNVVNDLERKTERIERLEQVLDQQQKQPAIPERISVPSNISLDGGEPLPQHEKTIVQDVSAEEKIILKERIENHLIIDEMDCNVAVIQRGIFRDISKSFADFLGFERTELLQKNFFVFIAPRGFDDARRYYLNRLKGVATNTFRTVLLTKDHTELLVEITVAPTVYKGDSAEFLSIKEIKDQS